MADSLVTENATKIKSSKIPTLQIECTVCPPQEKLTNKTRPDLFTTSEARQSDQSRGNPSWGYLFQCCGWDHCIETQWSVSTQHNWICKRSPFGPAMSETGPINALLGGYTLLTNPRKGSHGCMQSDRSDAPPLHTPTRRHGISKPSDTLWPPRDECKVSTG